MSKSSCRNKLLVEGRDDACVVSSLLKHYQIPEVFEVRNKEGIDQIITSLPVELKGSEIDTLGILVDADINIASRWAEILGVLRNSGYTNVSNNPDPNGTIIRDTGRPTIGIWLMPNNIENGMLEDFVRLLVPDQDRCYDYAKECVERIAVNDRKFKDSYLSKAEIHTWLAWQADPGTPMGLAITKKYLDANCSSAKQFVDWVRRLFLS